jgi:thiamine pyrophosphate-dependent acetolactate synthase large subunit-like protein
MAKLTVADQFVEILLAAGVRRMYGVVGDSLNPVVDAVAATTASIGSMCGMRRSVRSRLGRRRS